MSERIFLGGLWSRDTKAGQVISGPFMKARLVLFTNKKKDIRSAVQSLLKLFVFFLDLGLHASDEFVMSSFVLAPWHADTGRGDHRARNTAEGVTTSNIDATNTMPSLNSRLVEFCEFWASDTVESILQSDEVGFSEVARP